MLCLICNQRFELVYLENGSATISCYTLSARQIPESKSWQSSATKLPIRIFSHMFFVFFSFT